MLLRSPRIFLASLPNNIFPKCNLRDLCLRKVKFEPQFISTNLGKNNEFELAHKELAEVTGGLSLEQLKVILEPHKAEHKYKNSHEIQRAANNFKQTLLPTYNLAAYVDKSELLQQLVQLGVDLSAIEKRKGLPEFMLRLDLAKDIKPRLLFLKDHGVPNEKFGDFITKNPLIFKVDLDDMLTRVNYLELKRFSSSQIKRIITFNPYWLMLSTKRIDRRLGYFQKEFGLKGDDIRFLASKLPRLITFNMEHLCKATFCIREEMGFNKDEIKCLLLSKPKLWMLKSENLVERFAYAHVEMKLPHDMLLQQPEVLTSREFRLRERHEFLKMLGRAQYDPKRDNYISPKDLVKGNNYYFAHKIANSDIETFELFLKTK